MKFNLNINVNQAENGFVISINSGGAQKHFIAKTLEEVKKTLEDFISALEVKSNG